MPVLHRGTKNVLKMENYHYIPEKLIILKKIRNILRINLLFVYNTELIKSSYIYTNIIKVRIFKLTTLNQWLCVQY